MQGIHCRVSVASPHSHVAAGELGLAVVVPQKVSYMSLASMFLAWEKMKIQNSKYDFY